MDRGRGTPLLDVSPLIAFTQLEDLHIDLGSTAIHVSDRGIRTLAKALPRLISLTLRYSSGSGIPHHRPTLASLVTLVTRCPYLDSLHLADLDIDVRPDIDAAKLATSTLGHKLCELEIIALRTRAGRLEEAFKFAEKLDRLFPHLVPRVSPQNAREDLENASGMWSLWEVMKACLGFMQNRRRNSLLNLGRPRPPHGLGSEL